jgi:hypothetical protein
VSYSEISLVDIPSRHPVSLFSAYWEEKRGENAVPLRASIEPTKIPSILPWMLLLEAIDTGGDCQYRYRLSGTGCREIFGIDYTGKLLGENLTPDGAEARRREFNTIRRTGCPIYSSSDLPIAERSFIRVFRGVFPVSLTGDTVDQIFVIIAKEDLLLDLARQAVRPHGQQARLHIG